MTTNDAAPARGDTPEVASDVVVDLDAYCDRIGHTGSRSADLATLEAIVGRHTSTIPFENLDPFLGQPPRLDLGSLQAKLVHGGRGGYCFEHNLLLKHVLDGLGFTTTGLAARVVWQRPADLPLPPLSHMLVRVDLPEGSHLVDVGFGGQTPTGVLRLETGVEQATPHGPYRLEDEDGDLLLQSKARGDWETLYRFDLHGHIQADYEVMNWYVATHPDSIFVSHVTAARANADGRHGLNDNQVASHHPGKASEKRSLHSPNEILAVLEQTFGLNLAGVDRSLLADKLASLV